MRKEYRRAVREGFTSGLLDAFPGFEVVKTKSPLLFGGESVYRWVASDKTHCFVLLVPDPKGRQAFTVELGWSISRRFPEASSRPTVILGPQDPEPLHLEEGIIRLGGLMGGGDLWWELPDPPLERPGDLEALKWSLDPLDPGVAQADAEPRVREALEALGEVGIGFLERLVGEHTGEGLSPTETA